MPTNPQARIAVIGGTGHGKSSSAPPLQGVTMYKVQTECFTLLPGNN
jgi:hypothetical protein